MARFACGSCSFVFLGHGGSGPSSPTVPPHSVHETWGELGWLKCPGSTRPPVLLT